MLSKPRPLIRSGGNYVPAPRRVAPAIHADHDEVVASLIFLN